MKVRAAVFVRITPLLILAALIGVAGLAVLVAELTGAPRASNATNERSTLSVCVDGVGGPTVGDEGVQLVRDALRQVRADLADRGSPGDVLALLNNARVTKGCPTPLGLRDTVTVDPETGKPVTIDTPAPNPSSYGLRIYVTSSDLLQAWYGPQLPRDAASIEERACPGMHCKEQTWGLYLTDLGTAFELHTRLRTVLGFIPLLEAAGLPVPISPKAPYPAFAFAGVARTFRDAASLASQSLLEQPGGYGGQPQSIYYVQSTMGQAKRLFGLARDVTDATQVWVFVAYGQFYGRQPPGSNAPPASFHSVWIVVPFGGRPHLGPSNTTYDLSKLGEPVRQVALPLPRWPTPVELVSP